VVDSVLVVLTDAAEDETGFRCGDNARRTGGGGGGGGN